MATVYPTTAGDWSTRTWNDDSTGAAYGSGTPQTGDTVKLNGLAINLDQDITVVAVQNSAGTTAVAAGTLTIIGTRVITANLVCGTVDMVIVNSSSTELTVNGNVTGGASANADCIFCSTTSKTLTINGNVTGGSASSANGILWSGASTTITITGDVTGGSAASCFGFNFSSASGTATATVTGNVTGGSNASAGGLLKGNDSTLIVNGDVISSTGYGMSVTNGGVTINGDIVTSGTSVPLSVSGVGKVAVTTVNPIVGGAASAITISGGYIHIISDVIGGSGTNHYGINQSAGSIRIEGNVTGGSGANAHGVHRTSYGSLSVIGNVTGGSGAANGINNANTAHMAIIIGNVTGGSVSSANGIYSAVGTVNQNATAIYGTVTGGTNASAYGVRNAGPGFFYIFGAEVADVAAATLNSGSGSITTVAVGGAIGGGNLNGGFQ